MADELTSREFDAAIGNIKESLSVIQQAISRIESNSVTVARYDSGMNRVKDIEKKMDDYDARAGVMKTNVALLDHTVSAYRKFTWVLVGSTATLASGIIFWLITK